MNPKQVKRAECLLMLRIDGNCLKKTKSLMRGGVAAIYSDGYPILRWDDRSAYVLAPETSSAGVVNQHIRAVREALTKHGYRVRIAVGDGTEYLTWGGRPMKPHGYSVTRVADTTEELSL